jgi:hypothetical protein
LKVEKRRIYDIANVFEGLGITQKSEKNKIKWKGINKYNLEIIN